MFDLNDFIAREVTKRPESMFLPDIEDNKEELTKKIKGKIELKQSWTLWDPPRYESLSRSPFLVGKRLQPPRPSLSSKRTDSKSSSLWR